MIIFPYFAVLEKFTGLRFLTDNYDEVDFSYMNHRKSPLYAIIFNQIVKINRISKVIPQLLTGIFRQSNFFSLISCKC